MKRKLILVILLIFIYQIAIAHIRILNPVGGEMFNAGEQITIQWDPYIEHGPATFTIEFSSDGGNNWASIKTEIDKSISSYIWTLPNIQTNLAKIKVIQVNLEYDHISDQSEEFTIASVTSAVDESLNINNFKLYNSYPNPFNSSTIISYHLPENSFTQIIIYDLSGREIRKVVNQVKSAGKHEVSWNADGLSSGTYIVVLNTEKFIASKKIVFLK